MSTVSNDTLIARFSVLHFVLKKNVANSNCIVDSLSVELEVRCPAHRENSLDSSRLNLTASTREIVNIVRARMFCYLVRLSPTEIPLVT